MELIDPEFQQSAEIAIWIADDLCMVDQIEEAICRAWDLIHMSPEKVERLFKV